VRSEDKMAADLQMATLLFYQYLIFFASLWELVRLRLD
jgi:hypothetical protein